MKCPALFISTVAMLPIAAAMPGCEKTSQSSRPSAAEISPVETPPPNQVSTDAERISDEQLAEPTVQDDAAVIPLDRIWALDMPGTQKLSTAVTAAGEYATPGGKLLEDIVRKALTFKKEGEQAKPGFAVVGTGVETLTQAHAALVNGEEIPQTFPSDNEFVIVFFSHSFGWYVHLEEVVRYGTTIMIRYHFVPHRTKESTSHLALIPLGNLPPGQYNVKVVQLPMEQEFLDWGLKPLDKDWEARVVCRPFQFVIELPNRN
jgi:hypothetical protein